MVGSGHRRHAPAAPGVRLVFTASVGLDCLNLAACRQRGIVVAGAGVAYSEEDVADLAVGLLIDVLKKVSAGDWHMRRGLWSSEGEFALWFEGIRARSTSSPVCDDSCHSWFMAV
ncbi:hypothetical protein ACJRO7_020121 [Eucalyptus globulus]|uniref:D-isomer specific 2-hydroxyacid dehydrogenase catalytic domain-containing protein n=1 Tax=Eucalyptus globulus TaxID=34317 RepID=A0ABD3KFL4_EUCGL